MSTFGDKALKTAMNGCYCSIKARFLGHSGGTCFSCVELHVFMFMLRLANAMS